MFSIIFDDRIEKITIMNNSFYIDKYYALKNNVFIIYVVFYIEFIYVCFFYKCNCKFDEKISFMCAAKL